jgi:hypothetical protein
MILFTDSHFREETFLFQRFTAEVRPKCSNKIRDQVNFYQIRKYMSKLIVLVWLLPKISFLHIILDDNIHIPYSIYVFIMKAREILYRLFLSYANCTDISTEGVFVCEFH